MTLVVFNQKGGVGKSTIASNLAAISAAQGLRTLLIDLDQQGNSTRYLLGDSAQAGQPTVASFFEQTLSFSFNPVPPTDFVLRTPFEGLDLMAASDRLDELQVKLESRHKIYKLREALQQLGAQYERIYVDTPPALNFYTRSALMGAAGCLIPFDCDDFSRQALYTLLANLQEIRADHNPGLAGQGHRRQPVPVARQAAAAAGAGVDRRGLAGAAALSAVLDQGARVAPARASHDPPRSRAQADPGPGRAARRAGLTGLAPGFSPAPAAGAAADAAPCARC